MDFELVLVAALAGGAGMLITAAIAAHLFNGLRPLHDHAVRGRALSGTVAEVTLAIPEGGVGGIAHGASGGRSSMPARHVDGGALHPGARVVIVDVTANVARVRPLPTDLEEVFRC